MTEQDPQRLSRPSWGLKAGLASQGFSSASNFLLVVSVARVETASSFGGFAIAYSISLLVLGSAQGVVGETMSVLPRVKLVAGRLPPMQAELGAALLFGLGTGTALVGVGWSLGASPVGPALIAFGFGMPILLVQDAARFIGFSQGKPMIAAASDAVWLTTQLIGTTLVYAFGQPTAVSLIAIWGLSALLGVTSIIARVGYPNLFEGGRWLALHHRVGLRFAGEFLIGPGSNHITLYVVGAVTGLTAAGSLRAAQTIYGPLNTLLLGVQAVALPEASQARASEGERSVRRFAVMISAAFLVMAILFSVVVILLPTSIGEALFGATWGLAVPILLPLGLRFMAASMTRGFLLGLRALRAFRWSSFIRVGLGVLSITFGAIGGVTLGATGAAYGLAVAHLIGAILSGLGLRLVRVQRPYNASRD